MSDETGSKATGRLLVNGYIDIPAERWDKVRVAMEEHIRLTRDEPGCIKFDLTPCREVELRILLDEIFESQEAFEAHQVRTKASEWAKITDGIERHFSTRVEAAG